MFKKGDLVALEHCKDPKCCDKKTSYLCGCLDVECFKKGHLLIVLKKANTAYIPPPINQIKYREGEWDRYELYDLNRYWKSRKKTTFYSIHLKLVNRNEV